MTININSYTAGSASTYPEPTIETNHARRARFIRDTVAAIAVSFFALFTANLVERDLPEFAAVLRLVPAIATAIWIIRRLIDTNSSRYYPDTTYVPSQPRSSVVYVETQPSAPPVVIQPSYVPSVVLQPPTYVPSPSVQPSLHPLPFTRQPPMPAPSVVPPTYVPSPSVQPSLHPLPFTRQPSMPAPSAPPLHNQLHALPSTRPTSLYPTLPPRNSNLNPLPSSRH